MNLVIEKNGLVRGVFGEEIALDALGPVKIERTAGPSGAARFSPAYPTTMASARRSAR